MSVDYYKYTCRECGNEFENGEGMLMFSDKCNFLFQCRKCRKVKSVGLTREEYDAHNFPECCGAPMILWTGCCPQCGTYMDKELLYSDVI